MDTYRVIDAAAVLGISDDTVRRWIDAGRLRADHDPAGRTIIPGADLAAVASELADRPAREQHRGTSVSARNRLTGIVTRVTRDAVMAQVELICGPYRVVSLMSTEAADELGLAPGVQALASVKSTNVVIERT